MTTVLGAQIKVRSQDGLRDIAWWEGASDDPQTIVVCAVQFDHLLEKVRPHLLVEWGNKDTLSTVAVDIDPGVQLTITGTRVRVRGGLDPVPTHDNPEVQIAGSIGFGWRDELQRPLYRSRYLDNLEPEKPIDVAVPNFATSFMPVANTRVDAIGVDGSILYIITRPGNARVLGSITYPVPLCAEACNLRVTNLAPEKRDVRLRFGVTL